MDLVSIANSSCQHQSRVNNEKRVSFSSHQSRHAFHGARQLTITRVAVGDFKGQTNPEDDEVSNKHRKQDEHYRRHIEMMGGVLREGYGLGAIITAGMIRSVSLTSDLLKGVRSLRLPNQKPHIQRQKIIRKTKKGQTAPPGSSITEILQRVASESLASPITWNKAESHEPDNEEVIESLGFEQEKENSVKEVIGGSEQQFLSEVGESVLEEKPPSDPDFDDVEEKLQDSQEMDNSDKPNEEILDNYFESLQTKSTKSVSEASSAVVVEDDSIEENKQVSKQEEDQQLEEVYEENNIEAFTKSREKVAAIVERDSHTSVVFNKAMEILDEIADFEKETGESVDSIDQDDELKDKPKEISKDKPGEQSKEKSQEKASLSPEPINPSEALVGPTIKEATAEAIRQDMEREAKRRLKAMKRHRQNKKIHGKPVKVEKPSKFEDKGFYVSPNSSNSSKSSTYGLKGLDYIKSFAKESQDKIGNETSGNLNTSEGASALFYTPPALLQDGSKAQNIMGTSSSYSRWNEVERLQKVREIGTVLWRGRGGGGDGGSGGSGGNDGGGSGFNDAYGDRDWWKQVVFSVITVIALIFKFLRTISNHVGKQNHLHQK